MKPTRAAAWSVASNAALVTLKLATGLLMGSVSVLSEAIHSALDLLAAVIALFSVRSSARPADATHHFGHGKIENVSGVVEALLIAAAAVWIIVEAARKLAGSAEVESLGLGLAVMGFSATANYFVSRLLFRVARQHDSLALEADALHLRTDVYTSAGVFAGLGAIAATGVKILDPIVAIGVALLILRAAWRMTRNAFLPLLDAPLPEAEQRELAAILESFEPELAGVHKIRTRKAGPERHIDLHVMVRPESSITEAHALGGRVKHAIQKRWPRSQVLIHLEPGPPT